MATVTDYEYRGYVCPESLIEGLQRYIHHRIMPGSFLQSVLANDLRMAVARADDETLAALPAVVAWVYNEAPSFCWGTQDIVNRWVSERSLEQ